MQVLLDKTLNIISIQGNGLLIHSTCLYPFYSPDSNKVAFWVQDYDYQNDVYLSSYQLYYKNLLTNELVKINTGNGSCPLPQNNSTNEKIFNASFSPDGENILFLTTSTNLIQNDLELTSKEPNGNRWYVYNIVNKSFIRVSSNNLVYGNDVDANEALWYDNDSVVFVTLSNNLVSGINQNTHYEVYMKKLSNGSILHISKKENSNPYPFFTTTCNNIAVAPNIVSFYSYELGFVIKNINTNTLTRVQELSGIISYGIVTPETLIWSSDGSKMLFRITSGTTITVDTNNLTDDFVYDFNTNTIIPLNENSGETVYGNGYSKHASFSPDGKMVAFISNSYNIDPTSTNPIDNLYFKNLDTKILTRVSKSITNGNISNHVLGYTWITNNLICFTSYSNDLVENDTNIIVDWFVRNISDSTTIKINYNNNTQLFSNNNVFEGVLRKETFNEKGTRIVFSTKLKNLNPTFYTSSYDEYDIFEKIFIEEIVSFPTSINHSVEANDAINAYVDGDKLLAYTINDSISGTPTYSIVGSSYVERVNSINYRNVNSNIRWMSFKYPNLPFDCPTPAKIGVGLFNSTNTLLDDIIDIKQNNTHTTQNPVYGTVALISVRPQNDIVLTSAGDDQQRICDPIVYLQATVQGNLQGHTFLWELMSGDPVNLYTDSQTQAHYVVDSSTKDRVFRFWIDKGKYNEQYKDVKIYATPTDYFSISPLSVSNIEVLGSYDPLLNISLYSISSSEIFDYNIFENSSAKYNQYSVTISWSLPDLYLMTETPKILFYKSNFVGSILEININGVWNTLITISSNDTRFYPSIPVGAIVRIGAIYHFKGKQQVYYGNIIQTGSLLTANDILNAKLLSSSNLLPNKTVKMYELNILDMNDEIQQLEIAQSTLDYTKNNKIYDMTILSSTDQLTNEQFSTSSISYTIYRYNGAVIGG